MEIDHNSLASSYHSGIIAGFSLVASALQNVVSLQERVRLIYRTAVAGSSSEQFIFEHILWFSLLGKLN